MRHLATLALLLLAACGETAPDGDTEADGTPTDTADTAPPDTAALPEPTVGEAIFRRDCAACHTLGHGDERGPDLLGVTARRPEGWLRRWLRDPAEATGTPYGAQIVEQWGVLMPDPDLTEDEITAVIAFLGAQSAEGPLAPTPPVALTEADFDATAARYFDRCAGCHGTLRAGATGPEIDAPRAAALGTDALAAVLRNGRPWGMPSWGASGLFTEEEIAQMAAFLQLPPPPAPPFGLDDARATWEVLVAPEDRPATPQGAHDVDNLFGVVLRDAGQVALIDGDTKEEVARVDVGFAVHILRSSSTGRYFYAVGRDGWVTMIDLWTATPAPVARVRGCFDARSVEGSKAPGHEDRFLVEGCYWPPQYVVFDGQTLEPLALGDVLGPAVGSDEPLDEVRVASIVAAHEAPVWALSLKESGYVAIVDYTEPGFPIVETIAAERFLHDGGLDRTGRYFLVAANASDRMVVIDLEEQALVASFETGTLPHPGRGANWEDPEYGWVNATTHLGEGKLAIYGADPVGHPEHAWKVVREVALPSAGSLFLKTHPASPWVLLDLTLSTDPALSRQICAYSKADAALDRCFEVSDRAPVVHPEFDATGSEVWVSVWDDDGEVVVYDAVTLVEKARLTGLRTPTGKFNVHNTANDVY